MITVALCGMGYWGKNLLRTISQNPGLRLKAVVDRKVELHEAVRVSHPHIQLHDDLAPVLADPEIDAVVIATPVSTHYPLARDSLMAGKHVLIEKPMCGTTDEARDLVLRAEAAGLALMVDHTFLFHPAVRKLGMLAHTGALGRLSYYDSHRVNLGLFQPDVNVLWDLAPHDLSIIDHLFGDEPLDIEANGYCHINPTLPDIAYVTLHYPKARVAHLNLSWMSPVKVRRVALGGSSNMAVWDDLNRDEPLKIYDSGISPLPQAKRETIIPGYRVGDVTSPRLPNAEPLADLLDHFRRVIRGEERSRTDGRQGLRIVRTLERAQAALDVSLRRVRGMANLPTVETVTAE